MMLASCDFFMLLLARELMKGSSLFFFGFKAAFQRLLGFDGPVLWPSVSFTVGFRWTCPMALRFFHCWVSLDPSYGPPFLSLLGFDGPVLWPSVSFTVGFRWTRPMALRFFHCRVLLDPSYGPPFLSLLGFAGPSYSPPFLSVIVVSGVNV